ncbi:putative bifunctional diguanylate cyclase/phosphodiesterase [Nitrospirota bacterium]
MEEDNKIEETESIDTSLLFKETAPTQMILALWLLVSIIAVEAISTLALVLLPEKLIPYVLALNVVLLLVAVFVWLRRAISPRFSNLIQKISFSREILDSSSEAILITGMDGNIEYVNPAFESITGYGFEEVRGKSPGIMSSGIHNKDFYLGMWDTINTDGRWDGEIKDRRKNGEVFSKWLTITEVKDEQGKVIKHLGVFTDITTMKQTEEHLEHLAHYDTLTRLANRVLFHDRLAQAMLVAGRQHKKIALLFVDLDRFKYVNDTFGHAAGDSVLKRAANLIVQSVRKNDTVARIGGDEFAIILSDLDDSLYGGVVAQKIVDAFKKPFASKGIEIYLDVSIGIAVFPADGAKMDMFVKHADMAMYAAKKQAERRFSYYDNKMSDKSFERVNVEANLRRAIKNKEFVNHYQPQLDMRTGKVIGMESLIRRKEDRWLIPPGKFIPLAEETGLIIPITEWTLYESCRQSKEWIDKGYPPLRMGVNVSATHFQQKQLIKLVEKVLSESGLEPKYLDLELTERIIMEDPKATIRMMNEFKELGVHLSIDDFGTGYSSLAYLKKLPVDVLKIDYAFVKEIPSDKASMAIVRSIISLAHNLGMKVIAEGVETESQLKFMYQNRCDEIQGFYFSVPLSVELFEKEIFVEGKTIDPKQLARREGVIKAED